MTREQNKLLMKGISRIDQPSKRSHGWYVRVPIKKKLKSKYFSDKKNGGKNAALLAAISWRNDEWKKTGKPPTNKHVVTVPHKSNNTGVVGVYLNERLNRYEAGWVSPEGKQKKTSVSIKKWGKEGAFLKACEIREEKERERVSA